MPLRIHSQQDNRAGLARAAGWQFTVPELLGFSWGCWLLNVQQLVAGARCRGPRAGKVAGGPVTCELCVALYPVQLQLYLVA